MTVPQTSPFGSGDLKTTGARHFQHTVCIDYKSARFIFVLKVIRFLLRFFVLTDL
jgi:cytochrome c oxidase subunit IV